MKTWQCCIVLLMLCSCNGYEETCDEQKSELASQVHRDMVETDWTWPKLYSSYKKYGKCVDPKNSIWNAELATTYSQATQFLLAQKWNDINQFFEISKKDTNFTSFIVSQLNEGMLWDNGVIISENASKHCPSGYEPNCQSIKSAIEESKVVKE